MLVSMGKALHEHRKARRASLGTIADEARISAPYLLKLERGEVNTPSPRVLARIARALEIPYLRLMELAGYLDEEDFAAGADRGPRPHPLARQSLSQEEWGQVGAFIADLVARRPGKAPEEG
ncbi:helix-turn-helix domain-containing protein [Gemmatimonadota bacterium]